MSILQNQYILLVDFVKWFVFRRLNFFSSNVFFLFNQLPSGVVRGHPFGSPATKSA